MLDLDQIVQCDDVHVDPANVHHLSVANKSIVVTDGFKVTREVEVSKCGVEGKIAT